MKTPMQWAARVLAAAALLAGADAAWAQRGHEVPMLDYSPPWLGMLYTAVFLAGVAVVAFKNARRTHLR